MPLQNRVTPLGELIADPARGLVYGNRGCLHDEAGRIRRRASSLRALPPPGLHALHRDLARAPPRPGRRQRGRCTPAHGAGGSGDARATAPRITARRAPRRRIRLAGGRALVGARQQTLEMDAGGLRGASAAPRRSSSGHDHAAIVGRGPSAPAGNRSSRSCTPSATAI